MNRHALRERDYLKHMLDAVQQIRQYTLGKTAENFRGDRLLQDAVVRNIEVLGEASKNLLNAVPDAASRYPRIPFAEIYAMRNQLSHGYFTIDLDVVWNSIQHDIPELQRELQSALLGSNNPSGRI
jgi:uncharacterized protein with HEPN domain